MAQHACQNTHLARETSYSTKLKKSLISIYKKHKLIVVFLTAL